MCCACAARACCASVCSYGAHSLRTERTTERADDGRIAQMRCCGARAARTSPRGLTQHGDGGATATMMMAMAQLSQRPPQRAHTTRALLQKQRLQRQQQKEFVASRSRRGSELRVLLTTAGRPLMQAQYYCSRARSLVRFLTSPPSMVERA